MVKDDPARLEKELLGASLLPSDGIAGELIEKVEETDFSEERHRIIFEHMRDLYHSNDEVDSLTLTNRLEEQDLLEKVGGAEYISDMLDISISYYSHYREGINQLQES